MSVDAKRLAWALACLSVIACVALGSSVRPAPAPSVAASSAARPPAATTPRIVASPIAVRPTPDVPAAPRPTTVPDIAYHVPILMYHRVVPSKEAGNSLPSMVVEPDLFRAQLKKLRSAGWRAVTLERLGQAMAVGEALPARTFVVTIDDGWNDGYRYAFPILRDLGFHATYFVITNRIGWKDFLSGRQLRQLQAGGNEIGNHTMDHASLMRMSYPQAVWDIEGASRGLELVLGRRPVSLSYPKGDLAPFVLAAARGCPDLQVAVTTQSGRTEWWSSRFELPRLNVNSSVSPAALLTELERG